MESASRGHIEIVKLCREYGATDFDEAMCVKRLWKATSRLSSCAENMEQQNIGDDRCVVCSFREVTSRLSGCVEIG